MTALSATALEIIEAFGLPEECKTHPIPREKVLEWFASELLDAHGALYAFLTKEDFSSRVNPPLMFDETARFSLNYLRRCFVEDCGTEWIYSRFEATYELRTWFHALWAEQK